jgi:hypothetical protein
MPVVIRRKLELKWGLCKGRYKYNVWHFGHYCACMLHTLYTTFRAKGWYGVLKLSMLGDLEEYDIYCGNSCVAGKDL